MDQPEPECVFCQKQRPQSDPPEHVFPQWVSRTLRELPGDGCFHISSSDPALPSFECAIIELTTSAVCRDCNHHWMSDLESVASPALGNAIKGGPATFHARHHEKLATWAVKTAMMLDCAYGDLGVERYIPDGHCHDLYVTKRPRTLTFVGTTSFGYFPGTQEFRHAWAQRFRIAGIRIASGENFESYVVTFQYGYLAVLVAFLETNEQPANPFRSVDLVFDNGDVAPAAHFIAPIWPTAGVDVSWPPRLGLDATALELWGKTGPFFTKA